VNDRLAVDVVVGDRRVGDVREQREQVVPLGPKRFVGADPVERLLDVGREQLREAAVTCVEPIVFVGRELEYRLVADRKREKRVVGASPIVRDSITGSPVSIAVPAEPRPTRTRLQSSIETPDEVAIGSTHSPSRTPTTQWYRGNTSAATAIAVR